MYGGRAYEPQIDALSAGVDIVVGTPGRLLDLAQRRHLDLSAVQALVLDEADKMLDLGFLPDVERIVRLTPADRQTMLFSATMPPRSSRWPAVTCGARPTCGPKVTTSPRPPPARGSTCSARTRWTRSRCWPGCCRPGSGA